MHFKGQLLIPNDSGPGLRVDLDVAAHHLAVETESGGLGAWPLEVVDVRRLQGDVFAMTVAGEDLHFVADDALTFAYSAVPAISSVTKLKPRSSGFRSFFSKIWDDAPESTTRHVAEEDTSTVGESVRVGDLPIVEEPIAAFDPDPLHDLPVAEEGIVSEADPLPDPPLEAPEISVFDWEALDRSVPVVEVVDDAPSIVQPPVGELDADLESDDDRAGAQRRASQDSQPLGCPGVRSDGLACKSPILTASGYCVAHDPTGTVAHGYRAAHEARARLKAQSVARLNRVYRRLDKAMRQVERGELDPEIAKAMAQLARTMCAILDLDEESNQSPEDP
jgi:hypothetical protein